MNDKFFEYANKVTQAGEYLLDHGFKAHQVVEISQAFLGLTMVESRIVRECKKNAFEYATACFNEYGQSMIVKGLQIAEEKHMTAKDIADAANRYHVTKPDLGNEWVNTVMVAMLTYAAIGYESTKEAV